MYYSLNLKKTNNIKDGDHLLYRRFSFSHDFKPEIIVVDFKDGYNVRSLETPSIPSVRDTYIMIQCIDPSEIEPCNEDTHPEYYM